MVSSSKHENRQLQNFRFAAVFSLCRQAGDPDTAGAGHPEVGDGDGAVGAVVAQHRAAGMDATFQGRPAPLQVKQLLRQRLLEAHLLPILGAGEPVAGGEPCHGEGPGMLQPESRLR